MTAQLKKRHSILVQETDKNLAVSMDPALSSHHSCEAVEIRVPRRVKKCLNQIFHRVQYRPHSDRKIIHHGFRGSNR